MSVASAVVRTATPALAPVPSLPELEDLLYDILASGADPNLSDGTLEAVQVFVHEHARSKKSHAEFVAFFEARGLPFKSASPSLLALPPIETRGQAAESPALPAIPQAPDPALLVSAANGGGRRTPWMMPTLTLAAISCGLSLGLFGLLEVRSEFAQLRREAAEGASAIARLQAENADLHSRVRESTEQLQRIERKTELLLQSFASPIRPNQR